MKILGQRRFRFDGLAAERVWKAESVRVQELPAELPIRNAVDRIADDGKIDRLQVHSDLVRPTGFEPYCKQRMTREEPLDFEVGDRILRSIGF